MDEMMRGQRGWRELQALGDKINQFTGIIEGLIWSPKASDSNDRHDDWAFEEVHVELAWIHNSILVFLCLGELAICHFLINLAVIGFLSESVVLLDYHY
jgi:protein phosphatase 1G